MNHTNNEFENGLEKPNSVIHTNQDPINPALLSPVLDPNTPSELHVEHVSSENIIVDGEYSFNNDSILSYNSDINMSYTDLPVIIASNHSSAIHSNSHVHFEENNGESIERSLCLSNGSFSTSLRELSFIDSGQQSALSAEQQNSSCNEQNSEKVPLTENVVYYNLKSCYRGCFLMKIYNDWFNKRTTVDEGNVNTDENVHELDVVNQENDDCESVDDEHNIDIHFNRNQLSTLIIEHEFFVNGYEINTHRLEFLAKCVVSLFQTENILEWYGKTHRVTGLLFRKYQKLRYEAITAGHYTVEKRNNIIESEGQDLLKCLQPLSDASNIQVNLDFKNIWDELHDKRVELYKLKSISEIFEIIPILKTVTGLQLLEDDFDKRFNQNETNDLLKVWPSLSEIVLRVATSKPGTLTSKILGDIKSIQDEGHRQNIAICTIPCILGAIVCVPNNSKKRIPWKASTQQVLDSFILIDENFADDVRSEDLENRRKALKAKYARHNLDFTAYIIVCGPLNNIKKTLIILDEQEYVIDGSNSLLKAISKCSKAVITIQKNFQRGSVHVWQFFLQYIYKIGTDSSNSALISFISKLDTRKLSGKKCPKKRKIA